MLPYDPRVKSGNYYLCGCDYCNKPTYERELEDRITTLEAQAQFYEASPWIEPIKVKHIYHHINPQTGLLHYLKDKVKTLLALQEKIETHIKGSGKNIKYEQYI